MNSLLSFSTECKQYGLMFPQGKSLMETYQIVLFNCLADKQIFIKNIIDIDKENYKLIVSYKNSIYEFIINKDKCSSAYKVLKFVLTKMKVKFICPNKFDIEIV